MVSVCVCVCVRVCAFFSSAQHKIEVNLIQRFSPFKTMEDIMGQFDKIVGNG